MVVYLLVAFGVGENLTLTGIIEAKDFALAKAARQALGNYGLWFTVALAIIATASGLFASVFSVSRILTMLTDMHLVPHRHFAMTGPPQRHLLVYTVVIAVTFTILFDLSRTAALGAIFYLIMDIGIHWDILRHPRAEIGANALILSFAIVLDLIVLGAFLLIKAQTGAFIIVLALAALAAVFAGEWLFLRSRPQSRISSAHHH